MKNRSKNVQQIIFDNIHKNLQNDILYKRYDFDKLRIMLSEYGMKLDFKSDKKLKQNEKMLRKEGGHADYYICIGINEEWGYADIYYLRNMNDDLLITEVIVSKE